MQNALSFLESLRCHPSLRDYFLPVVRYGSNIFKACQQFGLESITVGDSYRARLAFELGCRGVFKKKQICFTLYGPPMLRSQGYLINVNGCAYSNLFYPEIPFWNYLWGPKRAIKEIIDVYRRRMTLIADYWIFETDVLAQRAIQLCGFPPVRVGVVWMAPSALVSPEKVLPEWKIEYSERITPGTFRILFLSGAHPNKRLHLLPAVAEELVRLSIRNFRFVLTVPEGVPYGLRVFEEFCKRGLSGYVCNIGPVPSERCASLIDNCDIMATFSRLESFSNNFVEAWRMERPLVATDADWARDACGEAAIYVDPADAKGTAKSLAMLMMDEPLQNKLIMEGCKRLTFYNTPEAKLEQYAKHIERARELGMLLKRDRAQLRWP